MTMLTSGFILEAKWLKRCSASSIMDEKKDPIEVILGEQLL